MWDDSKIPRIICLAFVFFVYLQSKPIKPALMKHILTAVFLFVALGALGQTADENYPLNFPKDQDRTRTDRVLNGIGLDDVSISVTNAKKMYNDMTARSVVAKPGQTVMPTFNYTGRWMHGFVYVDKDQNGQFDVQQPGSHGELSADNELVSFSGMSLADGDYNSAGEKVDLGILNPVAFMLPESLQPGFYMMRYKVDWDSVDPAGNVSPTNHIVNNGGGIVDVRLRIYTDEAVTISATSEGGSVKLYNNEPAEGLTWRLGQSLPLLITPDAGNRLKQVSVRHGLLSGDSLVDGVAQYVEETIPASSAEHGLLTLDGSLIDGDVQILAEFEADAGGTADGEVYTLVFCDEFDQPDGSRPDLARWQSSTRRGSTWNRYISDSPDVAFIRNGALVCRAIKNPDTASDAVPMLTGAMETRDLFSFTYGKVEVRLKTIPHTGSFPAAWMMPQPPCDSWPNAGEIDIFESIDAQNIAYHTVHSHWTYDLGNKNNPQSSFTSSVDIGSWHVFGIVWDEKNITWTVDGKSVGTYKKSTSQTAISRGQWPFEHDFYVILNQSVGDGSWAAKPDEDFTYETLFDYVRVYQKVPTGIETIEPSQWVNNRDAVYDLSGRKVTSAQLKKGIYIRGGNKVVIK